LSGVEEDKVAPNTVVLFEADGNWNTSGGRELMLTKSRHHHLFVVGFADGHVEQVTESRRSQLRWNP
jgi:prepilin-type processing-associated H-X9-DG protein